jgi:hypothetical protein
MITRTINNAQEPKAPLTHKLKTALVPLTLITFGILNGVNGNPTLLIVGLVSGCLAVVQPYFNGKRVNPNVKRAFLLMLGALVSSFLSFFAKPAQAQFFQNAENFFDNTFTSSGGNTSRHPHGVNYGLERR